MVLCVRVYTERVCTCILYVRTMWTVRGFVSSKPVKEITKTVKDLLRSYRNHQKEWNGLSCFFSLISSILIPKESKSIGELLPVLKNRKMSTELYRSQSLNKLIWKILGKCIFFRYQVSLHVGIEFSGQRAWHFQNANCIFFKRKTNDSISIWIFIIFWFQEQWNFVILLKCEKKNNFQSRIIHGLS